MKRAGNWRQVDGAEVQVPERRLVEGADGRLYVAELRNRTLTLKPYRAQHGATTVTWEVIYRNGVRADMAAAQPPKRVKRVRRGLLSL